MSGVWKSSLGLAVWLVEVPTRWSRPSLVFLGRLVRLPRTGGRLALSVRVVGFPAFQVVPASALLSRKGFCHLARGGGGSCVSLSPSNSPTTRRTVLRSDGVPPSTQQHPQHYVTCLFRVHFSATSGEEKEREKLILFPSYLEGSTKKTRCLVEMVVNDQAEPPGWTERGRLSWGLAEGILAQPWILAPRLCHTKDPCSVAAPLPAPPQACDGSLDS